MTTPHPSLLKIVAGMTALVPGQQTVPRAELLAVTIVLEVAKKPNIKIIVDASYLIRGMAKGRHATCAGASLHRRDQESATGSRPVELILPERVVCLSIARPYFFTLFCIFHWGGFAPPNPPLPVGLRPPIPNTFFSDGIPTDFCLSWGGFPPYW